MPEQIQDSLESENHRLICEVERLRRERDEAQSYLAKMLKARQEEADELRAALARKTALHESQQRTTLAFRADWLREKERADALSGKS